MKTRTSARWSAVMLAFLIAAAVPATADAQSKPRYVSSGPLVTLAGLWLPSTPLRIINVTIHTGPGLVEMWMEPHRPHRSIAPVYLQVP